MLHKIAGVIAGICVLIYFIGTNGGDALAVGLGAIAAAEVFE